MATPRHIFSSLSKPIQRMIEEKGFLAPTDPQTEAIPPILEGKNVLLIAPTGTGKTEAAFLPILNKLIMLPERLPGIKILYLTPLRALNRDLLERLEWWGGKLDVKIAVRHGDTDVKERAWQARSPPDLLITTPETLQAILPGRMMRENLKSVLWVIVDEINEFAEDKRGSQLSLALQRLRWITGRDFQLVGLSATIGSPEKVAKFLVGSDNQVEIVKVPVARFMKFEIVYPAPAPEDYDLASKLYTHPEVATRLRIMRSLIEGHNSVLLFTNTRAIAEVLASRFKVWDINFPVSIHHGSLAKPARVAAERGLKDGQLKGLVCTSSLELGIDVGRIDLCIQYMSPRQVTRLLQRVGRSGHRVGRLSKGVIITMDADDTLEALVIARRAYLEELELVKVPEKPYDVLNHQIVGLFTQLRRWDFEEILKLFKKAYPYRDLTEEDLVKVLTYMSTRYPRLAWVSFEDKQAVKPKEIKEVYQYYYENLSMIPDEKKYLVIDETNNVPVGVLDEAFVAEHGEPGTKFIVRGSVWKILDTYGDKIYVKPQDDPTGAVPSWVGEEIPVPFEVALEVGEIRAFVEDQMKKGMAADDIAKSLAEKYPADKDTILRAISDTVEQARRGLPMPTNRRITVEDWEDYVIIHASFGSLVNKTLTRLIGHILSEKTGSTVGVQEDPYRIMIQTGGFAKSDDVVEALHDLAKSDVHRVAVAAAAKTSLFKRRMIHVARRFGALSKFVDLSNVSLGQLSKSFEGTAIYEEAVKETLDKDLDIDNTRHLLEDVQNDTMTIVRLENEGEPSPIARTAIENIDRVSDLIPPEKMNRIIIESARARILSEMRALVCTECWKYVETKRLMDLPDNLKCPKCGSDKIGITVASEEDVIKLGGKKGKTMSDEDERNLERLRETAQLTSRYGRPAVIALAGRNLRPDEAEGIVHEENSVNDHLFSLIVEAEKKALSRRFW